MMKINKFKVNLMYKNKARNMAVYLIVIIDYIKEIKRSKKHFFFVFD